MSYNIHNPRGILKYVLLAKSSTLEYITNLTNQR